MLCDLELDGSRSLTICYLLFSGIIHSVTIHHKKLCLCINDFGDLAFISGDTDWRFPLSVQLAASPWWLSHMSKNTTSQQMPFW